MKKRLYILLLIFLNCGLDPVIQDRDQIGEYFVFCTLNQAFPWQEVFIGKSMPEDNWIPIDNAKVIVFDNSQAVNFRSIGEGKYRDSNNELTIFPDSTYWLDIQISSNKHITGETKVPGDFTILSPAEGDTITNYAKSQNLEILPFVKWTSSERAKFYTVYLTIEEDRWIPSYSTLLTRGVIPQITFKLNQNTGIIKAELFIGARDSTFKLTPYSNFDLYPGFSDSDLAEYYDDPFFEFVRDNNSLQGAQGVFNSINTKSINLYIRLKNE
jgi:hypothetical protein